MNPATMESPAPTKEVLDQMVHLMEKSGKIGDIETYRKGVYAREEESRKILFTLSAPSFSASAASIVFKNSSTVFAFLKLPVKFSSIRSTDGGYADPHGPVRRKAGHPV